MAMVEQEVVRRRIAALSGHLLQAQDPGFAGLNAQGCAAISTTLYAQPASETAYARVDTFSAGPDTSADSGPLFSRPVLDEEKPPMRSSTVQDSLHKGPAFARPVEDNQTSQIPATNVHQKWTPKVSRRETKDYTSYDIALPGVKSRDLRLSLEGNSLRLSGLRRTSLAVDMQVAMNPRQKGTQTFSGQGQVTRRELYQAPFVASWPLPAGTDAKSITARSTPGHLTVAIPKRS